MLAYIAVLFYVLSPGILLRIPSNGSKMMVAAVHAVVFAVVYSFTHRQVWLMSEGFQAGSGAPPAVAAMAMPAAKPVAKPAAPAMAGSA